MHARTTVSIALRGERNMGRRIQRRQCLFFSFLFFSFQFFKVLAVSSLYSVLLLVRPTKPMKSATYYIPSH